MLRPYVVLPPAPPTTPSTNRSNLLGHLTLLSPDEWLLMGDIENLVGQIFPREVIPGFEPSVKPLQPKPLQAEQPKQGRSVRARTGGRRRR